MEAVYPGGASALARGRRVRRAPPRARHRTMPVTFAEIKEVDEECAGERPDGGEPEGAASGAGGGRRRDELGEPLARQFAEFRRRRARRDIIREPPEEPPDVPPPPLDAARTGCGDVGAQ